MNRKVLLIDDDDKLRSVVKEYMEEYGFQVVDLPDGLAALSRIRSESPDIVILDVMMPQKDGFEVLREIRTEFDLPVIMLTAKGEDADRIVGLELGADDYLPKPFNPRELLARMKAIIRRSTRGEIDAGPDRGRASSGMQRQLRAILSADVQGYSRLMSQDEMLTIQTLKTYRDLLSQHIRKHWGRVVDSPGDNVLAEFGSVVNAVESAVEIQKDLQVKNADVPVKRKMQFRIGLNLGDVVIDRGRIYGDGVNIAARIERLADAGGICISGSVYDQIGDKLALGYEYLGEKSVKNIMKPVKIYKVLL